jgi:hypothetical protein
MANPSHTTRPPQGEGIFGNRLRVQESPAEDRPSKNPFRKGGI